MTRDSPRPFDEQDDEAEIFSALWKAAPSFPHLPPDAPPELRSLTVEVEDPKRVYSLYHASRRHSFQVLVERYINQLRFGCQDPRCNTSTCFSCRRRLAGSTPLRRYNTTSARTLACYLASQDNPEKGLCQYAGIAQGKAVTPTRLRISTKIQTSADSAKNAQRNLRSPKVSTQHSNDVSLGGSSSPALEGIAASIPHSKSIIGFDGSLENEENAGLDHVLAVVRNLRQPVEKDHKSFIQNLFGTIAFRMLDWLTPKSLESMTGPSTHIQNSTTGKQDGQNNEPSVIETTLPISTEDLHNVDTNGYSVLRDEKSVQERRNLNFGPDSESSPYPDVNNYHQAEEFSLYQDEKVVEETSDPSSKACRLRLDSLEYASPLSVSDQANSSGDAQTQNSSYVSLSRFGSMNGQSIQHEGLESQRTAENQETHLAKKTRKRLSSLNASKPSMSYQESISPHSEPQPNVLETARQTANKKTSNSAGSGEENCTNEGLATFAAPVQGDLHSIQQSSVVVDPRAPPQSLSTLSLETIDFIRNNLQKFGMRDIKSDFKKIPTSGLPLWRARKAPVSKDIEDSGHILINTSPEMAPLWKAFIEQSLFYVLSSPKALLKTFSEREQEFFDTQTLWYCMTQLIYMEASLVFDSLWIAAADLYPPRQLWPIYDSAKKNLPYDTNGIARYTSEDTARLMSICLHALIAAVPYTRDSAQLFALSRIRSYGISSVQRRGIPAESIDLYLRTDDAFSDDLTVRLARRIFAAIPARRHYQDLLRPSGAGTTSPSTSPDILELVLAPLNFLDIEVPPILAFTPEDREIHEKRAPTLLIDWARTIMLRDWTGTAEVSADGAFGGALAMMSAIYEKRKSLLLGDVHFRTEYLAERLDSIEMPVEWLSFTPNNKTLHLLDYPYLFSPANLVTYFRAINYSRMSRSFEASSSMLTRIQNTIAPGTLMTDGGRRDDLFERLRTAVSKFLVLQIRRSDVLVDAFNHLWRREQRELLRPLKIKLGEESGEEGSDSGGVQQEFFRLAIEEALNPDYGTFTIDERTRMTWFQPGSPQPLWKFELVGLIISLAVYNGLTLPVTFPKALYRKLLGAPVTELHHIEDGWPDLASGLTSLLEWDEKDGSVSDVFSRTYEFSISSFGQQISRDMSTSTHWPQFHETAGPNPVDARLVDSQNRNEYVNDYILWLTDISINPQFEAFQRGFFTCLDRRSLLLFDPDVLQSVVEGVQDIDISELRRFTRYVGWGANHRTIKDFWSIVKKFDTDDKKRLLEFVTASDRIPVGGMKNLQFVIQRNGVGDIDAHLPTSYTCYGTLLLPEYSSKETLKEKLGMALENSKGFGFA